jgi:predicted DNA-binding transcriptional regulator AlpA
MKSKRTKAPSRLPVVKAKPATKRKYVPISRVPSVRLLDRTEVMAITGASYPTIWLRIKSGEFPRPRVFGGKNKWVSTEVDAWLANLPLRQLGGTPEAA